MYAVHTTDYKELKMDIFKHKDGKWTRKDLDFEGDEADFPKVMISNETLYVVTVVDGKKLVLLSSSHMGSSWVETQLLENSKMTEIYNKNMFDAEVYSSSAYVAYVSAKTINILKIDLDQKEAEQIISYEHDAEMKSIDLALNADKKLRFVAVDENDNIYYATVNSDEGSGLMHKVKSSKNSIRSAKISFNKYNKPSIVYASNKIHEIEPQGNMKLWSTNTISKETFHNSGIKDGENILSDLDDFDFKVDVFGNSRIVLASGGALFYIKEYGKKDNRGWRIDKMASKNVGDNLTMALDKKNRLNVMMQNEYTEWTQYYAEPVFVKYHDKVDRSKMNDSLTGVSGNIDL
jgi:hypothetical protein